ncbi:hypothetical protein EDB89DRAFT_1464917 [Lactarius sanguifluus]|nr:hypothetical protein EDB89DRAFT_1464917 [Lactarius sanguifluus]
MCHRRVVIAEFSCGHREPVQESTIDCGSTTCRYSANHIQGDHDHALCNNWMNPPEEIEGSPRPEQCSMHRR